MYTLYISGLLLTFYYIINCFYRFFYNIKDIKKFDEKDNYEFILKNIEYFKDNKFITSINYNESFRYQRTIEIDFRFKYDYLIVNYIYNNKRYKYYYNNNLLKFPMYSKDDIKNYVYINKIKNAFLHITNDENKVTVDITEYIIPFLGPNYNFYSDISDVHKTDNIIEYILKNNMSLNLVKDDFCIKTYDNFNNERELNKDKLSWNPNLQL